MTRNQSQNSSRTQQTRTSGNNFQLPPSNIKIETMKRIVIFTIATLILGTAQCSFFSTLRICPRTPDLIMGLILAVAICDNPKSAMVLSVGAGFFIDAIGGGAYALSPLIYFIYAVIIGAASQKLLKSFPAYAILLLPSLLYRAAATTIMTLLYNGSLGEAIISTLLLEAACTLILCLPIYPIMSLATRPLYSRARFKF